MRALRAVFHNVRASKVYENKAIGFAGDNFYNFVVSCDTELGMHETLAELRRIEDEHGRDRAQPRYSSRTLDLDLLLYDDLVIDDEAVQLPRSDIDKYAFVLRPLAEIAGAARHPVSGKTFARLWAEFDCPEQALWPVDLDLDAEE